MSFTLADMMQACYDQADWSKDSIYHWENNPTIAKTKYKETCVSYNACVLQRLGVLDSGKYIWHNKQGKVTGPTSGMKIIYPNKTLHEYKDNLLAGDIIMDGVTTEDNIILGENGSFNGELDENIGKLPVKVYYQVRLPRTSR